MSGRKNGAVMVLSLRDSMHLVSKPENLDESVQEVFKLMLGVNCGRAVVEGPILITDNELEFVTGVVGFGGILTGACVVRCGASAAIELAKHMTGADFERVDNTVKDGIGEICNMLAGAWKGKVPELAANCGLSVPAVITGRDYNLHVQAPEFQLQHRYCFGDSSFEVTIVCDGLK